MAECIEREALITKFKEMELGEHGLVEKLFADGVYAVIAAFPAADVAPVVHGQWKASGALLECQNCGEIYSRLGGNAGKSWNYCPNCGAKMDESMPKDGAD